MSHSAYRRRLLRAASVLALTIGLCAPATTPAAALPAPTTPEVSATAAVASSVAEVLTVELAAGWLPTGYQELNTTTETVPGPNGAPVTFWTTRYTELQSDGRAGPSVIYLETIKGGTGELAAPEEEATSVVVGNWSTMHVETAGLSEYRFSLYGVVPGFIGVVGVVGDLDVNLQKVVEEVVGLTELGQPDPGVAVDPGLASNLLGPDPGEPNHNMTGTGMYTNDWSTDGANATISKYAAHVYQGNIVAVWQSILWADQAVMKDWFTVRQCDVDGYFGQYTHNATYYWQQRVGQVGSDGIVGPATWGAADNRLVVISGQLRYRGEYYNVFFQRPYADYSWFWNGSYHYTGYYAIQFSGYAC